MNQNVLRSAFTVVSFWWVSFAVWGLIFGEASWSEAWHASASIVVLFVFGILSGITGVWVYIWTDKEVTRAITQGDGVRGLQCTLGEVPLIAAEPAQADELPSLDNVKDIPKDHYSKWFEKYGASHPQHAELMRVLLRIYQAKKDLPATHVPGGHGGRTLLEHSLLAGYFMDKLAHSWTYTGLRDRSGKRVVLKLRDTSYRFNPEDPLIAIIGVAHDIGKIEAYIFDKKESSKIVGINHEHDLTGARMIARLPQAWDIPDIDRQAMFLAIAHYHHPMELPLSPDRRAIDDRTIALMELLIKTDFVTSRVESRGVEPTEQEYEEAGAQNATTEVSTETLYQAFIDIINEHGRINSPDPRFNVATLCAGQGFSKPMLMLKEDSLRPALVKRLGLGSSHAGGDGRHQITIDLLERLDKEGILYRSHEGTEYSAQNALWNVDFMTRSASGATPEKKSGWSAVIVIDPKPFPKIEQMEPYWWFAVVQRGSMGIGRAINKKKPGKGGNGDLASIGSDWQGPGISLGQPQVKKGGPSEKASKGRVEPVLEGQPALASQDIGPVVQPPVSELPEQQRQQEASDCGEAETSSHNPLLAAVWEDEPQASPQQKDVQDSPLQQTAQEDLSPSSQPEAVEPSVDGPDVSILLDTKEGPDGGKMNIAPIDVKNALTTLVKEADAHGLQLKEMAGRTFASTVTLSRFVPEIEWAKARYKIEQMAKTQLLDVWVVPLKDDAGGYALAFIREQFSASSEPMAERDATSE